MSRYSTPGVSKTHDRAQNSRRTSMMSNASTTTSRMSLQPRQNSIKRLGSQGDAYTENINVIVRCRGRGPKKHEQNSPTIVATKNDSNQVQITLPEDTSTNDNTSENTRIYTLDKVFGPSTDQMTFFQNTADGICEEFIKGFNCTIFAYGQTGAGKTYTMSGKVTDKSLTPESGIIPRCLHKLFDNEANKDTFFKCSFVEIYNEVLKDLLGDGSNDNKLKIYEQNKSIRIQSLEEFYIRNFDEAMKMLELGMNRKRVASTKMNEISSRSHTIFTIHLIKKLPNGSEYQFAKMNLVDLAGSENISRSGSTNKRAKEAGLINQSLLTLGRVINALVEGSSFIPYRESKLTRLLQDSLGGRTKTLLVANIAPTLIDLQSTLSTLEYASKAKDIKNSAQTGPLLPEELLVNELVESNRMLKLDLMATRRRENCVVLDDSVYKEMQLTMSNLKDEVDELRGLRKSLLNQLDTHMKKSEQHKKEKATLNETIETLEKKLVDFENTFREQKQHEDEMKIKCQTLCATFNENIDSIQESQSKTRTVLNDNILKSLSDVTSNLSSIHSENLSTVYTVKQIHTDIENVSSKLVEIIDSNKTTESVMRRSVNNTTTILNDINQNKEFLIKSINGISGIVTKQEICNNEFRTFLKEVLQNEDTQFMQNIQKKVTEKISAFKEQIFSQLDTLVNENINASYGNFLEHYKTKLLNSEKTWNASNEQLIKETKQQQLQLKENINGQHNGITNVISSLKGGFSNAVNKIVELDSTLDSLNKSVRNVATSTVSVQNRCNERSVLVDGTISDIKGNMDRLNRIVVDMDSKGGNIKEKKDLLRKSVGQVLETENISIITGNNAKSRNTSPKKSPVKLMSLNSNINLNPRSPSKLPRSPTRSPIRSPAKNAFGLKRESSTENLPDSKRRQV